MTPAAPPPGRHLAVACSPHPDHGRDWPLLAPALAALGITATRAVWTDDAIDWSTFDLVLAHCAWDHIHQHERFVDWVHRVAATTDLVNSPATLRWNLDKRYLGALATAGVPIVPTRWIDPEAPAGVIDLPEGEFVVKPAISGGGFETARYRATEQEGARLHIARLQAAGRVVMLQPYQGGVDRTGELGLVFLGGRFSHAINKGPLLHLDAGPQQALWPNEVITAAEPLDAQLQVGRAALQAAESLLGPTTYARVDLVPLADGQPGVLELELVDPALFFDFCPSAAGTFAEVLAERIRLRAMPPPEPPL